MKYIGKMWMLALPLAILAGCTKDESGSGTQASGGNEIVFEPGFADKMHTRVATDAGFNSTWEDGDQIGIVAAKQGLLGYGNIHISNARLTYSSANGGSWSLDEGTALYWPQDGTALDFFAYYPYVENPDYNLNFIRVHPDQSGETDGKSNYNISDMLTAVADNDGKGYAKGTTIVPLDFHHAMALVQTTLDNETGLLDTSADMTVTLQNAGTAAVLSDIYGNKVSIDDRAPERADIAMHRVEQPGTPEYATTYTYRALVPAGQTFEAGTSLFRITDGTTTLRSTPLTEPLTLVAGQAEKFGQQMPLPNPEVKVFFTEGEPTTATAKQVEEGLYVIAFGGTGSKTVFHVIIDGYSYFIGRKDNETVTLRTDPSSGALILREAVDDGSGTPKIPIGTFTELQMIGRTANLGGNYLQEGDLDLLGLVDEGRLDQPALEVGNIRRHRWTPIGTGRDHFTGSYDGGGHTISNLYINTSTILEVGLFGVVGMDASLSGIEIVSGSVTSTSNVSTGGVCGINHGTLTDCNNSGAVKGVDYIGGVCGWNRRTGALTDCDNSGTVSGSNYVGGVCGYNDGTITDCDNSGSINGSSSVGGVSGYNSFGNITACDNSGPVTGSGNRVAGVCGENRGAVIACRNTGAISGTGFNVCVGGVVGENFASITASYNTGTVTGEDTYAYHGGVCGYNQGNITACYNTGEIVGIVRGGGGGTYGSGVCGVNYETKDTTATITACFYLDRGIPDPNGTAFGPDEGQWPTKFMDGWAEGISTRNYWMVLGLWYGEGLVEGDQSIFPMLYWEL